MEWQPIETAPSGTPVIVSCGAIVGEALLHKNEQWRWANNFPSDEWGMEIYPDHWMPLPEPPQ
jgi:hypothetical protein